MMDEKMLEGLFTSYVNLARKHGAEPVSFQQFKCRMDIWEW